MQTAQNQKPNAETLPAITSAGTVIAGKYAPPPQDHDGQLWIRTTSLVQGDAQRLYELWRQVELIPRWQEEIESVIRVSEKISHWVMRSGDKTIEWDSEILADEPGRRIAWRSIGGESQNAGEVIFEAAPGGRGTLVTVLQQCRMGKVASAWETVVGRNPKQSVVENLRHFKALAETGEIPRIQGQPHGPRGTIAKVKAAAYAETIETPPGMNQKAG
jgi:uncharacterized membrane protein